MRKKLQRNYVPDNKKGIFDRKSREVEGKHIISLPPASVNKLKGKVCK